VRIRRRDGTRLAGVLALPPLERAPLVIYFGGNAEGSHEYAPGVATDYGYPRGAAGELPRLRQTQRAVPARRRWSSTRSSSSTGRRAIRRSTRSASRSMA
jgi:hypothetical protein